MKQIVLFILVTLFLKIIVHFFLFPTEVLRTNTDKKIYVQITPRQWYFQSHPIYKNLIFEGTQSSPRAFYYPKELIKESIEKHIGSTFTAKLWLFPSILIFIFLLIWIFSENISKSNFYNKYK
jgi:hypothetical protein